MPTNTQLANPLNLIKHCRSHLNPRPWNLCRHTNDHGIFHCTTTAWFYLRSDDGMALPGATVNRRCFKHRLPGQHSGFRSEIGKFKKRTQRSPRVKTANQVNRDVHLCRHTNDQGIARSWPNAADAMPTLKWAVVCAVDSCSLPCRATSPPQTSFNWQRSLKKCQVASKKSIGSFLVYLIATSHLWSLKRPCVPIFPFQCPMM